MTAPSNPDWNRRAWLLLPVWGNHGLWFALLLFNVIRAITLAAYYPRLVRGMAG